jgi:hypothetical protein
LSQSRDESPRGSEQRPIYGAYGFHRQYLLHLLPREPQAHVRYIEFEPPVPTRRVVLAWRRSFTRYEAIAALRNAVYACDLHGVQRLTA